MDPVTELENALGAELLRVNLLGQARPKLGDRYVIEDILGRGASGLVVAALDDRLNRPVALKIRPVEGDLAMLAEARALARLDHPNVVRVYDVEIVTARLDGRELKLWLVSMARLEGRTMRSWLRERQRSVPEILAVLVDVGRGLAAAHAQRIVHRDVKPDNIIVRPDGVAQVVDFGLAVEASSTQAELGGHRPAAGTDPYVAPEARVGRTTRKSDQFSLGVTLVEALTGVPMPAGRRGPSGVPAMTWTIAQRATSPDPADRYAEMAAMVDALALAMRAPSRTRFGPFVLATLWMGVVGAMVAAWWIPQAERAQPRVDGHAAPLVDRADGGQPPMDAMRQETDAARDPFQSDATEVALHDAGPSICRVGRRRYFDFHTTAPDSKVLHGCYRLELRQLDGCAVDVLLERRGFGNTPACETGSYWRVAEGWHAMTPEGALQIEGSRSGRNYRFDLRVVAGRLSGTVQVTGSSVYAGEITDDGLR